jgi:hypothetical protein
MAISTLTHSSETWTLTNSRGKREKQKKLKFGNVADTQRRIKLRTQ